MTEPLRSEELARVLTHGVGRIRPRARIIRTIGAELISSEVVAVIELVRNSWDADATTVAIVFRDAHLPEAATLEIRDNGHGMSREILLGPWLEPATAHKTRTEVGLGGLRSPRGRRRLGSKGVGRFAAQRLGHHLRLETMVEDAITHLQADFDWEELDSDEHYLDQMEIHWREVEGANPAGHGTSLQISRLRDNWTEDRFQRLRLGLSRLLGPGLEDDEFKIFLEVNGSREEIQPALDANRPMYSLAGQVDSSGLAELYYSDISGADETWERPVFWPPDSQQSAGSFRFRVNVWDLDREALLRYFELTNTSLGLRDFRRAIREHSGISLYRDGFRILPYGEADNDWLRLDRRRVNNPTLRLSNNQILGWIQLTADGNPNLRDQTNREGLVTNEAYEHLQQVVLDLLSYLEARRFKARRSLGVGQSQASTKLPFVEQESDREIDRLLSSLGSHGLFDSGSISGSLEDLRDLLRVRREAYSDTIRQYADLAATGQLASLVFTQIRHPLGILLSRISDLEDLLENFSLDEDEEEDFADTLGGMRGIVRECQLRMDRLDPFATPARKRKPEKVRVLSCVERTCDAFLDRFSELDVDHEIVEDVALEIGTDAGVIQSAAALVVENALYWLAQRKPCRRLRFRIDSRGLTIENNGPPIDRAHRDEMFSPHFTTRDDAGGMGLTLARDLLGTIGAHLRLARSTRHWTSFLIEFPRD